jgi:hypothetical protein
MFPFPIIDRKCADLRLVPNPKFEVSLLTLLSVVQTPHTYIPTLSPEVISIAVAPAEL